MVHRPHYWLDLIILALAWLAAFGLARRLQQPNRRLKLASIAALALLSGFGASLAASRVARQFAPAFVAWVRCFALFASAGLIYTLILVTAARLLPFQRTRR
ncbi:MAG TPA: hypothetical protein VES20_00040, partial [Bryobacteraceae bacterium]|nr:hypothetical protein [Bryobacteraceae bacterium]